MIRLFGAVLVGLMAAPMAFAFQAGAAKVDITPWPGVAMTGYGDRMGRGATGTHDPLWSRALYLDDGDTAVILVNTDLCIINPELRNRILELMPEGLVPPENILLTATHTHNGTGCMVESMIFRTISGPYRQEVLDFTADKIVESMRLAYEARQRATIGYGTTRQTTLSTNRRVDGGPIDEQIGVIRVDDIDGRPISIVGNFAAHPTTIFGEDFYKFSADYVGYFYNTLEELAGGDCIALFLNGAEGDQRPTNPENLSGWGRTESIGRLLAERVKEVSNRIRGSEATLFLGHSQPQLPRSVYGAFVPETTPLRTLEIDNLLMTFLPGEPCVDIGHGLRRRSLERGYEAQFSVGLANDHLLYFVPRHYYGEPYYETAMNAYGPRISDWFYREFTELMTKGTPEPPRLGRPPDGVEAAGPGRLLRISGNAYQAGFAQGAAFSPELRARYDEKVLARIDSGEWLPELDAIGSVPAFIDPTFLVEPAFAIASRGMTRGLQEPVFEAIEGMADAADMAFDAMWLLQCVPTFEAAGKVLDVAALPFCTMAVVGPERTGDRLLVGRNLDWDDPDPPVVVAVGEGNGRALIHVGFAWNAGVYTGMNDAGLVLSLERVLTAGTPTLEGPPIELLMRGLLSTAASVSEVRTAARTYGHVKGYHLLAADADGAIVFEFGDELVERTLEDGLLLGADPGVVEERDTRARYTRAEALFADLETVSRDSLADLLTDSTGARHEARIFSNRTRHSVVFEPAARRVFVRLADANGVLSAPIAYTVGAVEGAGISLEDAP